MNYLTPLKVGFLIGLCILTGFRLFLYHLDRRIRQHPWYACEFPKHPLNGDIWTCPLCCKEWAYFNGSWRFTAHPEISGS